MRDLPVYAQPPNGTATAVMLAQQLRRPPRQIADRLSAGGPPPVGTLATGSAGVAPHLYPEAEARVWLQTTPDADTLYDTEPHGAVTVAAIARLHKQTQDAVKGRLRDPGAPTHIGRLRAPGHPRLYLLAEVAAFLREPLSERHGERPRSKRCQCLVCNAARDAETGTSQMAAAIQSVVSAALAPDVDPGRLLRIAVALDDRLGRALLRAVAVYAPDPAPAHAVLAHIGITPSQAASVWQLLVRAGLVELVELVEGQQIAYRYVG